MVATREMLRLKQERQQLLTPDFTRPVRVRRPARPTPAGTPLAETTVFEYRVVTSRDGSVVATHVDGTAAQLTFVVPGADDRTRGTQAAVEAHEATVKFLRRRGPDYLPSDELRITLDARGRARGVERAS